MQVRHNDCIFQKMFGKIGVSEMAEVHEGCEVNRYSVLLRLLPSSAESSRWGEVRVGVVVGILWNGGVVRVNVATLNRAALWISRVAPWRT